MLAFAQICICVRFVILGCLSRQTQISWLYFCLLVQQLLHGVIFATVWTASTNIVQSMADNSLVTSAQSLVSTLYFVCGQGLGNVFWLTLYGKSKRGASPLYFAGSIMLVLNLYVFHRHEIVEHTSQKVMPETGKRNADSKVWITRCHFWMLCHLHCFSYFFPVFRIHDMGTINQV